MFPLGAALLPGERLPLQIFEPRYVAMIQACLAAPQPRFGVVLITRGREVGGGDERALVGTAALIGSCVELPDGRFGIIAVGEQRLRIVRWLLDDPYPRAEVEFWPDEPDGDPAAALARVGELTDELEASWHDLAAKSGAPVPTFADPPLVSEPTPRSFALASGLPIGESDRQKVLSAAGPTTRLHVLADALSDVIAVLQFRLL
ncbi:LON peptidase substrate-binding domain-containing protein [Antrihabitans sp. YC3-6]|uniref:LON peptidase substrate-binding domain-containing protein n=2 Tax=Antrihabitans TaxID=2799491 RepID=A0A934U2L5_9NOCA|nr:LON peptidase substrate-binding domain-containing protein [Antrihabitans stalagmiti]